MSAPERLATIATRLLDRLRPDWRTLVATTQQTPAFEPVTVRGVKVFRPDERRCVDPDRPVRLVIAGVAYSDLNADEARQLAAALIAAAA